MIFVFVQAVIFTVGVGCWLGGYWAGKADAFREVRAQRWDGFEGE